MKFSIALTGLFAALALAAPFSAERGIARRDSGILARAGPTSDAKDFDVYNGSNCLKLKREAEAAASDAAAAYKQYEQALARRSLEKKATPTTDSTNQDVYNGSGCLKFKREAESAAEAAAEAYAKYDSALAARGFVEV